MDHDDDDKLTRQFIEVTKRHRLSFLERLEEKYVKTQDQSDIIDLETMTIVRDRGHLKRMKPKPFGSISTYNCKPGQKIINVLKRRIKVKNKITIVKQGHLKSIKPKPSDTISTYNCKPGHLKKVKPKPSGTISTYNCKPDEDQSSDMDENESLLSYYGIKKSTVVLRRLSIRSETMKVGCGIDPLSFCRRRIISSSKIDTSKADIEFKFNYTEHISKYLVGIPICDLSFSRRIYVGDFQKNQKSKRVQRYISSKRIGHIDLNARNIYKTPNVYIQLEQEVEIEEEIQECYIRNASSVSKKSKKKEETNFHIPFSSKFLLEKSNFNFSNKMSFNPKAVEMDCLNPKAAEMDYLNPKAAEMDYLYERNLNSRNLAAPAIRPLPTPKVYSNFSLRSTKMSTPKHFSNLL